jgi:hypothetical protein
LEDPADRLPGLGPNQQVEVVGHEAVAEEPEGVAVLRATEGREKRVVIRVGCENIAAIENVVDQSAVDRSR